MKRRTVFVAYFILMSLFGGLFISAQDIHYSIRKIWDNGQHCAFTSLVKYQDKYYCSFREGETHIFDKKGNAEGKVRILVSDDGDTWRSVLLVGKKGIDFRDPKLSITPDGRLMVIMGGSVYKNKVLKERIPHVCFSSDGQSFSSPIPVSIDKQVKNGLDWIWRVTWHKGVGYAVNYSMTGENEAEICLLKTLDGVQYDLVTKLSVPDFPNETTVRFTPDERMLMMVRCDSGDKLGYWGVSEPPYKDWQMNQMEIRVGGPDFIVTDNHVIIAGSRSYYVPSDVKMVLLTGNDKGKFHEWGVLPSGGDTSYPSFLIEGDELWVSYYSSHETNNASIYLAKIPLNLFME